MFSDESTPDDDGLRPREYEDLADRRRHELLDLAKRYRDATQNVEYHVGMGEMTDWSALRVRRAALHPLIIELEPIMRQEYPDEGRHYWEAVELGEMIVTPPESDAPNWMRNNPDPEPRRIPFVGLQSLVDAPRDVQVTFTVEKPQMGRQNTSTTEKYELPVAGHILDAGYRSCIEFMSDVGLGHRAKEISDDYL